MSDRRRVLPSDQVKDEEEGRNHQHSPDACHPEYNFGKSHLILKIRISHIVNAVLSLAQCNASSGNHQFGIGGRGLFPFTECLAFMLVGAAVALYPRLLPSSSDASRDITIENALSGPHTLHLGLIWWTFGMSLAAAYFVIVYRMFRGKVSLEGGGYGH